MNRTLIYASRKHDDRLTGVLRDKGWTVIQARSPADFAKDSGPGSPVSAALLDLSCGYTSGEASAFEHLIQPTPIGCVALIAPGQLEDAMIRTLIRDACFDYVTLPFSSDAICSVVGHAYGMAMLTGSSEPPPRISTSIREMMGNCKAMQHLFGVIRKVASTDAPVFIAGESGTGKELTAVAIHERSPKHAGPFIAINCGAIQQNLMQSELFGYEPGAFTGATKRKIGRVESAHNGTLFLDEIGDLPLESQAGLLRFLQQGTIERLGGHDVIPVDVRIISATNVNLEEAVKAGRFRMDLYHRLCVLRIDEPPLRARGEDIETLANYVLERYKGENPRKIRGFTQSAIHAMHTYHWPGNVRELINRVRRAVVMAEGRLISAQDLDLLPWAACERKTLDEFRADAERVAIEQTLLKSRHRISEAAEELGISRITLYRMIDKYGIRHGAGSNLA